MSNKFNLRGRLTVTVHSARNLRNKELLGKMDPFCVVDLAQGKDARFKTKVAKDQHQNPVWEQSYIFNCEGKEDLLHCNVWNEATLGDDHIGRLDLSLDHLDMSGNQRWYQLKDRENFTKQTGEVAMSIIFDGIGLPVGSTAYTTDAARRSGEAAAKGVTSPTVIAASQPASSPVATPPAASPVATLAPPVVANSQSYGSGQPQPQYNQPPPQQQQQYQSQAPPQYQQPPMQQQQQPMYQSQAPQYQPPPVQQPMYQQPPAPVYGAPPMQPMQPVYQSQAPVYQQPATVVYSQPAPVYASQPVMQPMMQMQPVMQPMMQPVMQPQVIMQPMQPQIIGYWPNGAPRYAGQ